MRQFALLCWLGCMWSWTANASWAQEAPVPATTPAAIATPAATDTPASPAVDATPQWSDYPTFAEVSGYTDTARGEQVEGYLRGLVTQWDPSELVSIGTTVEGRPIWGVVVEPTVATEFRPITVLLLGGIHAGECDGKEALLALARDLAQGKGDDLGWQSLRLIFVPNFNADANERRGTFHRPGQAGPSAGMGLRENAQGLDLNRDFVKLETPEVRSLVAAINVYDVDVLIDMHTTNGSLHRYELTYDIPHNPATPVAVDNYLRKQLIPTVTQRMSDVGYSTFYYGNFDAAHRRWDTYGHEPRYSTEYMGVRGRIGILAESYSYASYETRVKVSYAFAAQVLKQISIDAATIRELINDSAASVAPGDTVSIQGKVALTAEEVLVKGYQTADGAPPRPPYGPESANEHVAKDYTVDLWNRVAGNKQVNLPVAYALDPQYAWAVNRLMRHGVVVQQLKEATRAQGEEYQVTKVAKQRAFQGHAALQVEANAVNTLVDLTAKTYFIKTTQPLGRLLAYLLEPESDDGLATWNFFDPDVREGERFPVTRIMAPVAAELLQAVESIVPAEKITLERLMQPGQSVSYSGNPVRGANWLKGSSEYVVSQGTSAYAVDAASGAMRPLTELNALKRKLTELEAFSAEQATAAASINVFTDDWGHALIPHKNDLYFFDAAEAVARQLTHTPDRDEQLATLSPDARRVAFVRDNNLWVVDCETTEVKQLTQDGSSELLNGILDWVYQEELYGRGNFKAFWWSPNGEQLAFLQLDQTPVPEYRVSDSISFGQSLEGTRYPKAGEPLPTVRAWIANVASGKLVEVDLATFASDDRLIARVSWSPAGELWLQVFNRVQNQQTLVRVDASTGRGVNFLKEESTGWIEVRGTPEFLPNGDFLWLSDLPTGRTHLQRVSGTTGQSRPLTSGEWDVESLLSISADHSTAFVAGNISNPIESHLIAVDLESGTSRQITTAPGSHRVSVDASGHFYTDVFSSISSPPFAAVHAIDGTLLRVIDAPTVDRHEYLDIRPPQLLAIPARDGLELQAMVMLPSELDLEKPQRQLPVVFHVYGGPQAPTVRNAWQSGNYWWHQMLCQQGYAVVLCDNRAARGRGVADTWTIRGDMGRVELQDLEDAVKWVGSQPWADAERIGMWGWSYGGYFTAYALTHSQLFKAGIAGAPVTDWRNYDAIYTERYMDLPQTNAAGYASSSAVEAAGNVHGRLLIIHGERDDNVHMSNALQLSYALQKAGKQFDLMIYPKNRHGVVDPDQRYHMHRLMTDFLDQHLKP